MKQMPFTSNRRYCHRHDNFSCLLAGMFLGGVIVAAGCVSVLTPARSSTPNFDGFRPVAPRYPHVEFRDTADLPLPVPTPTPVLPTLA